VAFFAGVALGCMVIRLIAQHENLKRLFYFGAIAYVAVELLSMAAQGVLVYLDASMALAVRSVLSIITGMFCATPFVFWISWLLGRSRVFRYVAFIAALIASYILVLATMLVVSPLLKGAIFAPSLTMGLCSVGSAVIQLITLRRFSEDVMGEGKPKVSYRLTPYSVITIGCLGFSWGMGMGAVLFTIGKGWLLESTFSLILVFAFASILTIALWVFARRGMRFGALIRLSIVMYGVALVTTPLLFNVAPALIYPFCEVPIIFGEVALIVFSIDVCREKGLSIADVFTTNYALCVALACIGVAFFWTIHTVFDGQAAWQLTTIVSVWAILIAIPFLPSRSSSAIAFTLDKLPEDEGYETNIALLRERLAQKYHLTESEDRVLDLLLEGLTREQIAAEIYLSPWTVKARISSIYRKCGIHSYKELVKLVSDDEV
ncbi:MAG: helix-turn-helix transcriptional regulator, partial [Raoultibacter sp.]